ncbi:MAG: molecular chaperone DnaJ [Acidobacteriota bacterium]
MPTAVRDFYETLGVPKDASANQIKAAYKRLARKHHPDRNQGSKRAEEQFKKVSEAYAVLGDPQKRRQYDLSGGSGFASGFDPEDFFRQFRSGQFSGGGRGGLGDIFQEIFAGVRSPGAAGRRASHAPPERGADLRASLSVDFKQAARGGQVPLEVARRAACITCRGHGTSSAGACVACGGSGHQTLSQGGVRLRRPCPACGGAGCTGQPCASCGGRGTVPRLERVKIRVPAGVDTGATIRLPGLGEEGVRGGGKGDLYIDIKVRPHPFLRRRGNDIEIELPVSVNEAACGASIRLPTIDGWATVKLPAGTSSGRRLRLRGKGVTDPRGGRRGDQYAVVQVVIPEKLNDRSRELLREFGKLNPGPPAGRGVWERS